MTTTKPPRKGTPLTRQQTELLIHKTHENFCGGGNKGTTFASTAMSEVFRPEHFAEVRRGYVRLELSMPESCYNGFGAVHGGCVATIFDIFTTLAIIADEIPEIAAVIAEQNKSRKIISSATPDRGSAPPPAASPKPGMHVTVALNCSYPRALPIGVPCVWEAWCEKRGKALIYTKGRVALKGEEGAASGEGQVVCATCDHIKSYVNFSKL
eukprot:g10201.t1